MLRWQPPLDIESQPYGFTTSLVSGNPTNQELAKENWAIGEWAPVHVLAKRATDLAGIRSKQNLSNQLFSKYIRALLR